ncbi:MAG: SAM-dependent methyltransferase [Streptosporangiales bacterium]|nr:SAM-dependent methyltransferase [Streptosporangiales bacterium]
MAGDVSIEVEYDSGARVPLDAQRWLRPIAGDEALLDRCAGPTLDVGSGPGRLVLALGERGVPALGIDITPHAVRLTRRAGGLALYRDVFGRVPGTGRWRRLLLADGNIGIGGDPAGLLRRVAEPLGPDGRALVELRPPGAPSRTDRVRLRGPAGAGPWFAWARVGVDDVPALVADAGLAVRERWSAAGRYFATLTP